MTLIFQISVEISIKDRTLKLLRGFSETTLILPKNCAATKFVRLTFQFIWEIWVGVYSLVTTFRATGPKMVYLTLLWSHTPNFHKQVSSCSNILTHTLMGAWNLVTFLGAIRPKMVYLTLVWTHTSNFHKQPLILFEILCRIIDFQFIFEIWIYWMSRTSWSLLGKFGPRLFTRHYYIMLSCNTFKSQYTSVKSLFSFLFWSKKKDQSLLKN